MVLIAKIWNTQRQQQKHIYTYIYSMQTFFYTLQAAKTTLKFSAKRAFAQVLWLPTVADQKKWGITIKPEALHFRGLKHLS